MLRFCNVMTSDADVPTVCLTNTLRAPTLAFPFVCSKVLVTDESHRGGRVTALHKVVGSVLLLHVLGNTACAPVASTRLTPAVLAADSAIRSAIQSEASLDASRFPRGSVGVLPFQVAATDTMLAPLGYGLAALLMTDLARSAQLDVVDRLRVDALLREQALARTAVTDPATGARSGRILGARHLVLGSLGMDNSREVRIDARLALTEAASVRPIVTGATSLDDILDAEKALAFEVFDAIGITLTPAERVAVEQRPTRDLGALLAFSRGARAESELRLFEARREFREAVRLDPAFEPARERIRSIDTYVPDGAGIAMVSIDAINRPNQRLIADVVDPAFGQRQSAVLILPIVVR
jgi:TolB-like protein